MRSPAIANFFPF